VITRDFDPAWQAGCAGAPPPLHVMPGNAQSAWYPLPRPELAGQPPGPVMVLAPSSSVGDDPLDPGNQTIPRTLTFGMVGRLNFASPQSNIDKRGVRRR